MIKLFPHILFEKFIYILALEMAGLQEPTLCQLYIRLYSPVGRSIHNINNNNNNNNKLICIAP